MTGKKASLKKDPVSLKKDPFVSLCMIARNESRFLGRALSSVAGLADEVVVVDTGSTDETIAIALSLGARVKEIPWSGDFSKARNASLEEARGEWIVVMDADEEYPPEEALALRRTLETSPPDVVAFHIAGANVMGVDDKRLVDVGKSIRVFRNRPQHRYQSPIHEQIAPSLQGGKIENTAHFFWHYGYLPDVVQEKGKVERNRQLLEAFLASLKPRDPFRSYVLMQLGRECQRTKELDKADRHFREALAIQASLPAPLGFYISLAVYHSENLLTLGRSQEALEFTVGALEHFPHSADLWFFRGVAELQVGETSLGIVHLLWATTVAQVRKDDQDYYSPSRSIAAFRNTAIALQGMGAHEAALQIILMAFQGAPLDDTLLEVLGGLLLARPDLAGVYAHRAELALQEGFLRRLFSLGDQALSELLATALLTTGRSEFPARFYLASCHLMKSEPLRAIEVLAPVPLLGEIGAFAQLARVSAYAAAGRTAEVQAHLQKAPKDLFHTLQWELAGYPVQEPPEDYGQFRETFRPMLIYWPRAKGPGGPVANSFS